MHAGPLGLVAANLAEIACSDRAGWLLKGGHGACRARAARGEEEGLVRSCRAAPAARPLFASTATGLVQVVSFVSVFHQYVLPVSSTTASHPSARGSSMSSAIALRHERRAASLVR